MSPREKAVELIQIYKPFASWGEADLHARMMENARQCALIAVSEIIEVVSSDESAIIVQLQYWQQVKEEIEKY